jgi:hypothetical protein
MIQLGENYPVGFHVDAACIRLEKCEFLTAIHAFSEATA